MDAKAAKKALYRSKLKEAAAHKKRIDSPLVRYNDLDQPVCRVCDVVLKSESLWSAHQASRKHHEAIQNVKAAAAGLNKTRDAKSEPHTESTTHKPRPSSSLPADFFDKHDPKRQKTAADAPKRAGVSSDGQRGGTSNLQEVDVKPRREIKPVKGTLPEGFFDKRDAETTEEMGHLQVKTLKRNLPDSFFDKEDPRKNEDSGSREVLQTKGALPDGFFDNKDNTTEVGSSDVKQAKGALPEGFFDNKDADLRARGIQPVKIDIKDEYKEFEKLIQEDLQEVDERLEEEEIDAADILEGEESLEQKAYRERVEMLKQKQLELKARRFGGKKGAGIDKDSSEEDSSSDDDDEGNFAVDWRAKRF